MIQRVENRLGTPPAPPPSREESIGDLVKHLVADAGCLIREEAELAKAELAETGRRVGRGAKGIGAGAVVATAGLVVLLVGAGFLVSDLLIMLEVPARQAAWIGPMAVGLLALLIGYGMVKAGSAAMKEREPLKETKESMADNREWLKDKVKGAEQ